MTRRRTLRTTPTACVAAALLLLAVAADAPAAEPRPKTAHARSHVATPMKQRRGPPRKATKKPVQAARPATSVVPVVPAPRADAPPPSDYAQREARKAETRRAAKSHELTPAGEGGAARN